MWTSSVMSLRHIISGTFWVYVHVLLLWKLMLCVVVYCMTKRCWWCCVVEVYALFAFMFSLARPDILERLVKMICFEPEEDVEDKVKFK